jgi:hypothetical protein
MNDKSLNQLKREIHVMNLWLALHEDLHTFWIKYNSKFERYKTLDKNPAFYPVLEDFAPEWIKFISLILHPDNVEFFKTHLKQVTYYTWEFGPDIDRYLQMDYNDVLDKLKERRMDAEYRAIGFLSVMSTLYTARYLRTLNLEN